MTTELCTSINYHENIFESNTYFKYPDVCVLSQGFRLRQMEVSESSLGVLLREEVLEVREI